MANCGIGANITDIPMINENFGISVFQIGFEVPGIGYPSYSQYEEYFASINDFIIDDVTVFVHAPFWYNFCQKLKWKALKFSLAMQCDFASKMGAENIVVHLGYRGESNDKAMDNAIEFLVDFIPYLDKFNVNLLLENSSGSKNNNKFGNTEEILIINSIIDNKRIGFCLDTAHSFANGDTLTKNIINKADLIHFNCPDGKVKFGSHLDRHSKSSIKSLDKFFSNDIINLLLYNDKYKILESQYDIALNDLIYLGEIK